MPLDPQMQAVLAKFYATGKFPIPLQSAEAARRAQLSARASGIVPEEVGSVEDRTIPGPGGAIPVRVYRPTGTGPFPILLYLHGGGWVLGDLDGYDAWCRHLTNRVGCEMVSVAYRLAPEHPFPAALSDADAALQWVATQAVHLQGDPARIAVGGDSAGGNLSAVLAQLARDGSRPALCFQLLLCPVTDHPDRGTDSYREYATGYGMTSEECAWFFSQYLPPETARDNALAFPLQARDLSGLAPALVVTAEYDVVRDDGELYAARLQEAGVQTTLARYDGMIHNFHFSYEEVDRARDAVDLIVEHLKAAFGLPVATQ
jgi:acetyl esterase